MVFKKDLTPLSKKGSVKTHGGGKAAQAMPMLPSRAALQSFTRPGATINDYAKATPGVAQQGPGIYDWDNDGV